MKKKFTMVKILSVVLTACILVALAAPSIVTISAFIEESVRPLFSSDEDYVGVGDIKPPEINENPYDVRIEFVDAPILNDYMYQMFIKDGTMTSVNTWERPMPGLSPYYTPSITPLYSYKIGYAGEVDSGLPYREGNDKLLQPDLKFGSTTVSVDMTQGPDLKALFPLLNWDQVYLRVGMTGIAGSNELQLERHDNTTAQRIEAEAKDGPESVYLDVPFNDLDSIKKVDFIAYRHGVVTDTHFVLIDNTAPSVTGVDFKKEGGQLILTLTFNEGLHWSDEFVSAETLNEIYVNVLLKGNGNHHLKMFISELGGENNNVLTFKGELGDYQYVNFTAEKIVNVARLTAVAAVILKAFMFKIRRLKVKPGESRASYLFYEIFDRRSCVIRAAKTLKEVLHGVDHKHGLAVDLIIRGMREILLYPTGNKLLEDIEINVAAPDHVI